MQELRQLVRGWCCELGFCRSGGRRGCCLTSFSVLNVFPVHRADSGSGVVLQVLCQCPGRMAVSPAAVERFLTSALGGIVAEHQDCPGMRCYWLKSAVASQMTVVRSVQVPAGTRTCSRPVSFSRTMTSSVRQNRKLPSWMEMRRSVSMSSPVERIRLVIRSTALLFRRGRRCRSRSRTCRGSPER